MMAGEKTSPANLQILNQGLADRTFLAGENITFADFLLFHSIQFVIKEYSFQEKENIAHVSRWFGHVQTLLNSNLTVLFSRTVLY
ncbi:eukaryotic translation elongation factor 1 epsilon-1 [Eurytemora carolleeae]|uniref:eukaryotic translation elongation factor 1 epsilon-1 n=1 Tax=Eurytemora carolleeae TaxID=1294199 RepID=UPI000C7661A9|nr:eukaryotic translation elongation factor 1 epsilon-1 [Eurytemora carolleeae]|eukprot:XP_023327220.1 eukaryotic translation elongation factor 1 epsilon-1-like [Eurytemora affinis]